MNITPSMAAIVTQADSLGRIGDERAVDSLIGVLHCSCRGARRAAVGALGRLRNARAVRPLVALLRTGDASQRRAAAAALGMIGRDPAGAGPSPIVGGDTAAGVGLAESLVEALADGEDAVRLAAAEALGKMPACCRQPGSRGRSIVERLLTRLGQTDSPVCGGAALALGFLEAVEAVDPLIAVLSGGGRRRWLAAAAALGRIGDPRAVEPLIAVLNRHSAAAQYSAAVALGDIGDSRAVPALIETLKDTAVMVRYGAVLALGRIGDPRAVAPLRAMLRDTGPARGAAAEALRRIDRRP